jgi:hypothetical protein
MIRTSMLVIAAALLYDSAPMQAQLSRPAPRWRSVVTVSHGLATGNGGALDNGTTFMQVMRGSMAILRGGRGIDVTAARLQAIIPQGGFNDMEYANPEGDAVILSYASAGAGRSKPPSLFALGGGVIRRQTAEAGRTRDTWVARLGYDPAPFWYTPRVAAGVSIQQFLSSSRGNAMVGVTAIGVYLRAGSAR